MLPFLIYLSSIGKKSMGKGEGGRGKVNIAGCYLLFLQSLQNLYKKCFLLSEVNINGVKNRGHDLKNIFVKERFSEALV